MATSFRTARLPQPSQATGTWVEIGLVYIDIEPHRQTEHILLNCAGLWREGALEFVLVADGYFVEEHGIGMPYSRARMAPDRKGSLELDVDEGADEGPEKYRCRLTDRDTLLCLERYSGMEFKKMALEQSQAY